MSGIAQRNIGHGRSQGGLNDQDCRNFLRRKKRFRTEINNPQAKYYLVL